MDSKDWETIQDFVDKCWSSYLTENRDVPTDGDIKTETESDSDDLCTSDDEAVLYTHNKYNHKHGEWATHPGVEHPLKVEIRFPRQPHPYQKQVLEVQCQMCDHKIWPEATVYVNKFRFIKERKRQQRLARKIVRKKKAKMEFGNDA